MELSIEFFPPKTEEGFIRLKKSAKELSCLQIEYASVTYGAGGSATNGISGNSNGGGSQTANTGNGGRGNAETAGVNSGGEGGGSGVIVLRIPNASYSGTTTGSPNVDTSSVSGFTILKYTGTGTYTG